MNGYLRRPFYLISSVVVAVMGTPFQPHSAYAGSVTLCHISAAAQSQRIGFLRRGRYRSAVSSHVVNYETIVATTVVLGIAS